ncbi:hypothetical protein LguiB_013284 [Lonicera macranthoides]
MRERCKSHFAPGRNKDIEVSSYHVLPQLASPKYPTLSWNIVSNASPSGFFFMCDATFEAASGKAVSTCVLFDKALCLSDGVAKKVAASLALMDEAKTIREAYRNIYGLVICSDLRFVISIVSLDLDPPWHTEALVVDIQCFIVAFDFKFIFVRRDQNVGANSIVRAVLRDSLLCNWVSAVPPSIRRLLERLR